MVATKEDLYIEAGATFDRSWVWRETLENGSLGDPVDLTGYTARMHIRRTLVDPDILVDANTENEQIILGGTAGTVQVLIPDEVTEEIGVTAGVYDLELESAGGYVYRLLEGKVKVSPNVTREPVADG